MLFFMEYLLIKISALLTKKIITSGQVMIILFANHTAKNSSKFSLPLRTMGIRMRKNSLISFEKQVL